MVTSASSSEQRVTPESHHECRRTDEEGRAVERRRARNLANAAAGRSGKEKRRGCAAVRRMRQRAKLVLPLLRNKIWRRGRAGGKGGL